MSFRLTTFRSMFKIASCARLTARAFIWLAVLGWEVWVMEWVVGRAVLAAVCTAVLAVVVQVAVFCRVAAADSREAVSAIMSLSEELRVIWLRDTAKSSVSRC